MYLKFGNLTVREFAEKVEAEFTDEEIATLETHRTNTASNTDQAKFHIFDDPAISIHIGTEAMEAALPIFKAANTRKAFNREIAFYPATA